MPERPQPTAAFWITVALVAVLVGYPLSFGPACWLAKNKSMADYRLRQIYDPLFVSMYDGPQWLRKTVAAYGGYWTGREFVHGVESIGIDRRERHPGPEQHWFGRLIAPRSDHWRE